MLEQYNAGINCECENVDEITNAINTLVNDENLRKKMGQGNRRLAEERFDRKNTYRKLVALVTEQSGKVEADNQ